MKITMKHRSTIMSIKQKNGSCYGSPRFLSGQLKLELTTLSCELVLELTTPTGVTT